MATKLVRATRQIRRSMRGEQPRARRLARKAVKSARRAAAQGSSYGRITPVERRAVRRAGKAVGIVTTPKERKGTKQKLRRKARRS